MVVEMTKIRTKNYLTLSDMARISKFFKFLQDNFEKDQLKFSLPLLKKIWEDK